MMRPRLSLHRRTTEWATPLAVLLVAVGVAAFPLKAGPAAAATSIGLGTAGSFAVLAGSAVTNTGPSTLNGDLGVSPGTAITGFPPGQVNGTTHAANAVAAQAKQDLSTAYSSAGAQATDVTVTSDLGGQVLVPGVYSGGALSLTDELTLDAQGDPNAVFLFRAASTFFAASSSRITLINGASACQVFVRVGSSATLGTASSLVGTFLVQEAITANTGARVTGRLLAQTAAVTLDTNVITVPNCAPPPAAVPPPTASSAPPTASSSPSAAAPATTAAGSPTSAAGSPASPTASTVSTTPAATATASPTPAPGSSSAPATVTPVGAPAPAAPSARASGAPNAPVPGPLPAPGASSGVRGGSLNAPDAVTAGSDGQVSRVPTGGVQAGGGATAGAQRPSLLISGIALLLLAGLGCLWRRRTSGAQHLR